MSIGQSTDRFLRHPSRRSIWRCPRPLRLSWTIKLTSVERGHFGRISIRDRGAVRARPLFLNLPLAGELGGGDSARSDAGGEKGE